MTETRDDEWEIQHLYALFYGTVDGLGMCGCGNPAEGYTLVLDLLDAIHERTAWDQYTDLIGTTGGIQIVLSQLDRVGLTEHGSSVYSAWLTEKGKYARWLMHRHPGEDAFDETGFPHDGQDCAQGCWTPPAGIVFDEPPPQPTLAQISERIEAEAAEARARMNPVQRAVWDQASAAMENLLLYGTAGPPAFSGLLESVGGVADPYEAIETMRQRLQGDQPVLGAGFPLPRATLPSDEEDRLPSHGRNTRIGCQQYDSGTWVHGRPHDCPRWARR
ncbi:hypothetical protein [Actinocrinis sp.]|uniref:hypothetical protein n=1 Tax=Actinocrinis sp. TaxID=1920516 RepID=UPI002D49D3E2|nr:hypothetical protein [Actinocrinis sp.]HZP54354.1 hypothetical protein [Actinocrinis sp.]